MNLPFELVNKIIMLNRPSYPYMEELKYMQKCTINTITRITEINFNHKRYPLLVPRRVKKGLRYIVKELQYELDIVNVIVDLIIEHELKVEDFKESKLTLLFRNLNKNKRAKVAHTT